MADALNKFRQEHPELLWGACEVKEPIYLGRFHYAVAIILPGREMEAPEQYSVLEYERRFHPLYLEEYKKTQELLANLTGFLEAEGLECFVPQIPENFWETLQDTINYKDVARRAGLGWIGRNNLLVCPEAGGALLNIRVFLTNDPVPLGTPVERQFCGSCHACVAHCPFRTMYDVAWTPDVTREQQLDYRKCHERRQKTARKFGYKMNCGRCMTFCPAGKAGWDDRAWREWREGRQKDGSGETGSDQGVSQ